jgi:hypothetical protein
MLKKAVPHPKLIKYGTGGNSLKRRADSVYGPIGSHQDGSQYPTDGRSSV